MRTAAEERIVGRWQEEDGKSGTDLGRREEDARKRRIAWRWKMEAQGEDVRQWKRYEAGLRRSPLLYETLEEMARQSGQSLEKWVFSFDVVTRDAVCVLAPALCGFVIWVLQRAVREGKRRLYFLARDGYLMYRLAKLFCRVLHLEIECRYLYCSRYSLRVPAFCLDMEGALDFVCRGGIDVTLEKILNRSGIRETEKKKVLKMLRLPYAANETIPYARLGEVREQLAGCKYFRACLERASREKMPGLEGYLRQEGLLAVEGNVGEGSAAAGKDNAVAVEENAAAGKGGAAAVEKSAAAREIFCGGEDALVDSGWTGSLQKTLSEVLAHFGRKEPLKGYYFGLYKLPDGVARDAYETYYFGPRDGLRKKVFFSNCLFETVFSAPHGMTEGYTGRYEPVFSECDEERCKLAERMELCVAVYGENLVNRIKAQGVQESFQRLDAGEFRRTAYGLLKRFMGRPTRAEAEGFGEFQFSDDVLEDKLYRVAAELTEEELTAGHVWNKALTMLGIRKGIIKESAWYEGSAARLGRHEGYHRKMYAAYKYLLYIRQMGWKR